MIQPRKTTYVQFLRKTASLPQYGIVEGDTIHPIVGTPLDVVEAAAARDHASPGHGDVRLSDVAILPPVIPSKIVGIGLNYRDHAIEQGKPLPEIPYVFMKAPSALISPQTPIRINRHCTMVHYEGELAVVIGANPEDGSYCKNVSEADALKFVAGYTIGNDVTDRTIQKAEASYARAKGMDTFCPLGPFLVTGIDWANRSIKTWVNGELRQSGTTADMIHPVPKLISFVSQFMTLLPGDVILTGTPKGVGQIKPGDVVKVEIDELGALENAVELDQ